MIVVANADPDDATRSDRRHGRERQERGRRISGRAAAPWVEPNALVEAFVEQPRETIANAPSLRRGRASCRRWRRDWLARRHRCARRRVAGGDEGTDRRVWEIQEPERGDGRPDGDVVLSDDVWLIEEEVEEVRQHAGR